jgi:hypothetical protein
MVNVGGFARFNGADNRPMYPAGAYRVSNTVDGKSRQISAFMLENTSKGYGWSANVTMNMQPAEWISLMAAYTHTVMKEVSGMPGSNATSAWNGLYTIDGRRMQDAESVKSGLYIRVENGQAKKVIIK